jgi:hypothetical protein
MSMPSDVPPSLDHIYKQVDVKLGHIRIDTGIVKRWIREAYDIGTDEGYEHGYDSGRYGP